MFIIEILEIGQIDVNDAIQLLQSFKAIIAVGVVNQRDIQPCGTASSRASIICGRNAMEKPC